VKSVEFAPAARAELDAAAEKYEEQRTGRGVRFYAAVERTVKLILRFPAAGPLYAGIRTDLGVRRRIVRGFPFVLAYRVIDAKIRIDAVAHMHRRPGYWHRRARSRDV
jgi:plasmid stabilization system protein ParE